MKATVPVDVEYYVSQLWLSIQIPAHVNLFFSLHYLDCLCLVYYFNYLYDINKDQNKNFLHLYATTAPKLRTAKETHIIVLLWSWNNEDNQVNFLKTKKYLLKLLIFTDQHWQDISLIKIPEFNSSSANLSCARITLPEDRCKKRSVELHWHEVKNSSYIDYSGKNFRLQWGKTCLFSLESNPLE